jgi:hypothetical protein
MKKPNSEADKLKSILVIVIGFLTLSLIFRKKPEASQVLFWIAFGVGFLSLLIPVTKDWILYVWDKIALVLGWINTRILLAVVFYVFLFPVSLLNRMFNKNMLQLSRAKGSVYISRNHKYTREDLENTW